MTDDATYADRYEGVSLQLITPEEVTDTKECSWLVNYFDGVIGSIEEQLHLSLVPDAPPDRDRVWRAKATRALRHAKALRNRSQMRLGELRKKNNVNTLPNVFMNLARANLPEDVFQTLLQKAKIMLAETEL